MRLAGADHRPLDVAHRLPPAQPLGVGPGAARGLVGVEERLELPEPGDRQLVVAEPPGADRRARRGPRPGRRRGRAPSRSPPRARRSSTIRLPSRKSPWTSGRRAGRRRGCSRSQRSPASTAGSGSPISSSAASHSSQASSAGSLARRRGPRPRRRSTEWIRGERRGELAGQPLARRRELVAAQDPRRDRGAGDELHQVAGAGAEAPARGLGGDRRGRPRRRRDRAAAIAAQLELERRERHPLGGLAPEHAARLAAGLDQEGLRARRRPRSGSASSSPGSSPRRGERRARTAVRDPAASVAALEPMAREVALRDVGRVLVPVPGAGIAVEVLRRVGG